jgi:hypothetical protein
VQVWMKPLHVVKFPEKKGCNRENKLSTSRQVELSCGDTTPAENILRDADDEGMNRTLIMPNEVAGVSSWLAQKEESHETLTYLRSVEEDD